MQWGVNACANAGEEIKNADHPRIRLFTVPNIMSDKPLSDCDGGWQVCSPETVPGFSAVGYYFGRELQKDLDVPVGLVNSSWGGSVCEAWMSREALEADPDFKEILNRAAPNQWWGRGMYNAMIHPLIPYGIRGAIWYQGESNAPRGYQYRKLFPALIQDWRTRWGQGDFPFLYVQLCPFNRHHDEWPEVWEAQLMTLKVPSTGMAVTTDIGDIHNIHPPNKQDVGKRLALWALAHTYGRKDIVYSGPLYKEMKIEGDKIRLTFDHGQGLKSRDSTPLTWFTIAGEDQKFHAAEATIDGDTVLVQTKEVAKPVAVRFGWSSIATPNLMNAAGLPASPFRTDAWKGVSAGRQ
jgi:sialate O-acetylesterase